MIGFEDVAFVQGVDRLDLVVSMPLRCALCQITFASLIHGSGIFRLPAIPRVIQSSSLGADRNNRSLMAFSLLQTGVKSCLMGKKIYTHPEEPSRWSKTNAASWINSCCSN